MTVKDFYHYYLNRPDRYHLTNTDKNVKMAKGTFIPLDIYIHDKRVSKLNFSYVFDIFPDSNTGSSTWNVSNKA